MLNESSNSTYSIQHTTFLKERGQEWIRTTEVVRQRIYSPPHLAALEPAQKSYWLLASLSHLSESNQRPTDYKSVALPAELKWHLIFWKVDSTLIINTEQGGQNKE